MTDGNGALTVSKAHPLTLRGERSRQICLAGAGNLIDKPHLDENRKCVARRLWRRLRGLSAGRPSGVPPINLAGRIHRNISRAGFLRLLSNAGKIWRAERADLPQASTSFEDELEASRSSRKSHGPLERRFLSRSSWTYGEIAIRWHALRAWQRSRAVLVVAARRRRVVRRRRGTNRLWTPTQFGGRRQWFCCLKSATFEHPLWSTEAADLRMCRLWATGALQPELERAETGHIGDIRAMIKIVGWPRSSNGSNTCRPTQQSILRK